MCFVIKKEGKTKKGKVCYKILKVYKDGTIQSPYYMKSWEINEEVKTRLIKRKKKYNTFSANGLYTYKNKLNAIKELRKFRKKTKPKFSLFKCIIPPNSRYYEGNTEICSERLIIKRKLVFGLL